MSFVTNIVGFTRKSSLPKLGKSDTYNMFVETKDSNEFGFTTILRPMPGYELVNSAVEGVPQGMYKCSRGGNGLPSVYGVWGKKLYLLMEKNGTIIPYFIGDIAGNGQISWCELVSYDKTAPNMVLCDGVNVYVVNTDLNPVRQRQEFARRGPLTMPYKYSRTGTSDERITPSWVAYMYGYLIVGAKGTDAFYHSVQYPFESDPVDDPMDLVATEGRGHYVFSEWQPDNTVVGCSNGSRLFTFGTRSFQIFTYQNSIDMPFASPDTAAQNIGIKNANSLQMYGDNVFWLGSSTMGDGMVLSMSSSGSPVRISTDEIEEMISRYNTAVCRSFVMKWRSHPFYVLSFPNDGVTLCYDIREKGWTRLGSMTAEGEESCFRYENAVLSHGGDLLMQAEGVLVKATDENWTEHDGRPMLRKRVGGILSSDNRPFKVGAIKLITNNGDYKTVLDHAPVILLRYSGDGGATWKNSSTRSLGNAGRYDFDTVFRNLGKVRYLTVEVGTSENVGFAIYGMDVAGVTCAK